MLRSFAAGLTLAAILVAGPAAAQPESRVALVIGNSSYSKFPVLANPANDARGMAEVLAAAGFRLYGDGPIIDGDRQTILKAIRGFGNELKDGSVGLFYYAGHGVQIEGTNYLLPVDAKIEKRSDVRWELVNVSDLLEEMQDAGILDACRNNPIGEPGVRGIVGTGLAQIVAPRGTFISYATAPGKLAEDGQGEHSPYTLALLETFKVPGLSLFDAFNRVALRVRERTQDAQEPWNAYSGISGDFYMLPPAKPEAPTTGVLALEVSPENAALRLDGQPAGQANGYRKEIPAGTHEYDIAAESYETRHGTVTVPAGGEKSMVVALTGIATPPPRPPPPRTTGTLELEVATPGAMLKLDGKELGAAKGFRQEVPPGRHDIVLSAEGFEPQRQVVVVPAGGEKSMVIALAPLPKAPPPPPPPTTGLLELEVSTPGATVRLDGKPMGLAKGFRRELPAGEHELEILADGYEAAKQPVTISPGIERSVMVALTAVPKPNPPAPAAPAQNERGALAINTDPASARITVDGMRQPHPGAAQLEVTPGEHVIVANGKGLVQQQLRVHVGAGERVQVPLQLARMPPPQPRAVAQPRPRGREEAPYEPAATRVPEPAQAYRPPVAAAPAPQPAPAAPSPSAKCFTFNGRQFCE